ncbi:MAG: aminopeptidase P N-terminal domain-containing protein [Saprospiraceae bacterium]
MKYQPINPALFRENRQRFTSAMKPNAIAIFNSNDHMPRSGDTFFPFRQNTGLFALCGIDQEETVLVLYPDCVKETMREVLFIRKTNEFIARWEGHKYTKTEVTITSGIQKVYWLDEMDRILNELILL